MLLKVNGRVKDSIREWVKKVYGPYTRKDGRQHVLLYGEKSKRRQTVSYPKWLMEQHLGRELNEDETVDHINRDFTDNRIENLQILTRTDHGKKDALRVKMIEIVCILCGETALKSAKNLEHNSKQGKAGPFCGRSCAGKYGAAVGQGKSKKRNKQPGCPPEDREYFRK